MSLKWLWRLGFPSVLRALAESFSRKYLILVMTDNVVRPPDGFYAVITSAPPSMALWIIQDYVVIPLILIALRFQSKYGNSKAALRSSEVLSRRHRLDLHFFPFTLYLFSRLSLLWSIKPTQCLLFLWSGDEFWFILSSKTFSEWEQTGSFSPDQSSPAANSH